MRPPTEAESFAAFALAAVAWGTVIAWFSGYAKGYQEGVKYCSKGLGSLQEYVAAENDRVCAAYAKGKASQQRAGIGN